MTTIKKGLGISLVVLGILAALLVLARQQYTLFEVPNTASMIPTLEEGDYVVVNHKGSVGLRHGELVAFEAPDQQIFIMRLFALPGDRVASSNQEMLLNGQPVQQERVSEVEGRLTFQETNTGRRYTVVKESDAPFSY